MGTKLKTWQGWLIFVAAMAVFFVLGLAVSALAHRTAETATIFNNKRVKITGIQARSDVFKDNYPREYATWLETSDTSFTSEFNGTQSRTSAPPFAPERPRLLPTARSLPPAGRAKGLTYRG